MYDTGRREMRPLHLDDYRRNLGLDDFEAPDPWWRLVEQIVQLEELIADLKSEKDDTAALMLRRLTEALRAKRTLLKSIDVG